MIVFICVLINPLFIIQHTRFEITVWARPTCHGGSCDFTKRIWLNNVELAGINLVFSCHLISCSGILKED